jgi:dolichol-phosphate mannosyltransferase
MSSKSIRQKKFRIAIIMPVYNEARGIAEFLTEIVSVMNYEELDIVVVDDCSTDQTLQTLKELEMGLLEKQLSYIPLTSNSGHGPATLVALQEGLKLQPDIVVAVDGDGQFSALDIKHCIDTALRTNCDVCEGVRYGRSDPLFRQLTTLAVRLLVGFKARSRPPRDANTPLRIYRTTSLMELLRGIPSDCLVPNLVISAKSRKRKMKFVEVPVKSLPPRRGDVKTSTMFGVQKFLPTRKFLRFIRKATTQFVSMPV